MKSERAQFQLQKGYRFQLGFVNIIRFWKTKISLLSSLLNLIYYRTFEILYLDFILTKFCYFLIGPVPEKKNLQVDQI